MAVKKNVAALGCALFGLGSRVGAQSAPPAPPAPPYAASPPLYAPSPAYPYGAAPPPGAATNAPQGSPYGGTAANAPQGSPYGGTASQPLVLRYDPNAPPPRGYHFEENPRKGLIVAGALTLGIPYLISLTIGGASRSEADRWLLVPVVGPVGSLTYGMRGCDRDEDPLRCSGNILILVGLAFDLAAQTAGAVLLTMGFVFPKKQWVSDYALHGAPARSFAWSFAPRVDAAGRPGLSFVGTF